MKRGPKTARGRLAVRNNAMKHGINSDSPVALAFESETEWREHLRSMISELQPVGYVEECLVHRAALLYWRLRRPYRYESSLIDYGKQWKVFDHYAKRRAHGLAPIDPEKAAQALDEGYQTAKLIYDVHELPDDAEISEQDLAIVLDAVADALSARDLVEDAEYPAGATAGSARKVLSGMAAELRLDVDSLLMITFESFVEKHDIKLAAAYEDVLDRRLASDQALLPDEKDLAKIIRYESHLQRQLLQILHELEARQEKRAGHALPRIQVDLDMLA